jgi:small subunit ribosomal protein S10
MKKKSSAKLHLKLMSFNHESLVSGCRQIVELVETVPFSSSSVVALPTNKRIYCVLRSPHVDKDSREHFEIRMHRRALEIDPSFQGAKSVLDQISDLDLPNGVFYRIYV